MNDNGVVVTSKLPMLWPGVLKPRAKKTKETNNRRHPQVERRTPQGGAGRSTGAVTETRKKTVAR